MDAALAQYRESLDSTDRISAAQRARPAMLRADYARQLLKREDGLPAVRAGDRIGTCSETGSLTADFTVPDHRHADQESMLPRTDGTPAAGLD